MPTISAANNLSIRYDDAHWRLFAGRADGALPVAEAGGEGFAYGPAFGTARRLPPDGLIKAEQVSMVVVGWAIEDSHWHLGLLFGSEIADMRGGRWCGLARWAFADGDEAEKSGQVLATILQRPFRLVPPSQPATPADLLSADEPASVKVASISTLPLTPLPIVLGDWQMREDEMIGLIIEHTPRWRRDAAIRAGGYFALTVAFAALSVGALMTKYAPVQPEWLPWVGVGVSFAMLIVALAHIRTLTGAITTIIDSHLCMVRQMTGPKRTALQIPYEGVESIIVSHYTNRREHKGHVAEDGTRFDKLTAEVWIHLNSPRRGFVELAYLSLVEGEIQADLTFESGHPLVLDQINTPAHHAAMHIARVMEKPISAEAR
jgi:hypothetical protein